MEFDFKLPGLGRPESSRPKRVSEALKNEPYETVGTRIVKA